jgi:hypothetical protein
MAYGCHIGDGTTTDDVDAAQSALRFCDATAGAVFRAADACCSANDRETPLYRVGHALYGTPACDLEPEARRRFVRIDEEAAARCIQDYQHVIAARVCGHAIARVRVDTPACAAVAVANVSEGGECEFSRDCIGSLVCAGRHCVAPCEPGKDAAKHECVPAGDGDSCDPNFGCARGLACESPGAHPHAALFGTCSADVHTTAITKQVGDPCEHEYDATIDGYIFQSSECGAARFCLNGHCSDGLPTGAACTVKTSNLPPPFDVPLDACKGRCDGSRCVPFCRSDG